MMPCTSRSMTGFRKPSPPSVCRSPGCSCITWSDTSLVWISPGKSVNRPLLLSRGQELSRHFRPSGRASATSPRRAPAAAPGKQNGRGRQHPRCRACSAHDPVHQDRCKQPRASSTATPPASDSATADYKRSLMDQECRLEDGGHSLGRPSASARRFHAPLHETLRT